MMVPVESAGTEISLPLGKTEDDEPSIPYTYPVVFLSSYPELLSI